MQLINSTVIRELSTIIFFREPISGRLTSGAYNRGLISGGLQPGVYIRVAYIPGAYIRGDHFFSFTDRNEAEGGDEGGTTHPSPVSIRKPNALLRKARLELNAHLLFLRNKSICLSKTEIVLLYRYYLREYQRLFYDFLYVKRSSLSFSSVLVRS